MRQMTWQAKAFILLVGTAALGSVSCGGTTVIQGSPTTPATVTQTVGQQPSPPPPPPPATKRPPSAPAGLRSCGSPVSANPHTSCPFANSVYKVVAVENGSAVGSYSVYSSVTGRSYTMNCGFEKTRMVCRGGNDAIVSWPG
jgi:serine/threonine-protein kinase